MLPNAEELGFAIKLARIQRRMTQDEFAERIGIGRATLCNIEKGKRNMTYNVFRRIVGEAPEVLDTKSNGE